MSHKFTVSFTYDRDEIVSETKRFLKEGATYDQVKSLLDTFYIAWDRDNIMSCMVELILRDEDDPIAAIYREKLKEFTA